MSDLLKGLNPQQREAAAHIDGAMLVLAGAGSGKTRVLTHRIARLIQLGIKPWNILAVTFTNKAAKEMRERVVNMTGQGGESVWLRTFHSACVRILRRDIEKVGYSNSFNIYDSDDQIRLMKRLLQDNNWIPKDINDVKVRPQTLAKRYLRVVDMAKLQPRRYDQICSYIEENADFIQNPLVEPVDVFQAYNARLKKANAIDFNDIINKTVHLWEDHPDILQYWQRKFRYVMVDEYQDTNPAQYKLLQLLTGAHKNIMVVGDDDQSIYGFRGADIANVNNFQKDFEAKLVRLEQNYRSVGNVIATANSVIENNPSRLVKKMWTDAEDGELIDSIEPTRNIAFPDERWEAKQICKKIRGFLDEGRTLSEMAIIYRTNASALVFEKAIRENRFNYEMIGSFKFYERQEVKDMLSYVKLLINPFDEVSFQRAITTPKRGIGPKSLLQIFEIARGQQISFILAAYQWGNERKGKARTQAMNFAQVMSDMHALAHEGEPRELMEQLLEQVGYTDFLQNQIRLLNADLEALNKKGRAFAKLDDGRRVTRATIQEDLDKIRYRWDNVQQVITEMQNYYIEHQNDDKPLTFEDWLYGYLDFVALNAAADKDDGRDKDAITMLTAHLCKGLEFPIVFVTGLWEGNFPHFRSLQEIRGIEEERRLAYVAMTRAKERLILSRPGKVPSGQDGFVRAEISTFWEEIPEELFASFHTKKSFPWNTGDSGDFRREQQSQIQNQGFTSIRAKQQKQQASMDWVDDNTEYSTREIHSAEDLREGVEVLHPTLGLGRIDKRIRTPNGVELSIVFSNGDKTVRFRPQHLSQLTDIVIR